MTKISISRSPIHTFFFYTFLFCTVGSTVTVEKYPLQLCFKILPTSPQGAPLKNKCNLWFLFSEQTLHLHNSLSNMCPVRAPCFITCSQVSVGHGASHKHDLWTARCRCLFEGFFHRNEALVSCSLFYFFSPPVSSHGYQRAFQPEKQKVIFVSNDWESTVIIAAF